MAIAPKRDTYTHTQTVAAAEWDITHSIGTLAPVVSVWFNNGNNAVSVIPHEIEIVDAHNIKIKFSSAQTGSAVIG
jgi:hypothetical protein